MRRTSVLLEFSENVYDALVEPLKRSKSFSKFVSALVTGYLNDPYIKAYADGNLDDYKKAYVSAFDDQLDEMSESLANMGFFADALESVSAGGKDHFAEKKKKAEEDGAHFGVSGKSTKGKSEGTDSDYKKDLEGLENAVNARMDRLENSMNAFLVNMTTLLQTSTVGVGGAVSGLVAPAQVDTGVSGKVSEKPFISMPSVVSQSSKEDNEAETGGSLGEDVVSTENKGINEVNSEVKPYVEKSVESVEKQTAGNSDEDDFISSMLDGNMFSFE